MSISYPRPLCTSKIKYTHLPKIWFRLIKYQDMPKNCLHGIENTAFNKIKQIRVKYKNKTRVYDLIAAAYHYGTAILGGHYVAYRHSRVVNRWIKCNDARLSYEDPSSEDNRRDSGPVLLVYNLNKSKPNKTHKKTTHKKTTHKKTHKKPNKKTHKKPHKTPTLNKLGGMDNVGNSCYHASMVQCVASIIEWGDFKTEEFVEKYTNFKREHLSAVVKLYDSIINFRGIDKDVYTSYTRIEYLKLGKCTQEDISECLNTRILKQSSSKLHKNVIDLFGVRSSEKTTCITCNKNQVNKEELNIFTELLLCKPHFNECNYNIKHSKQCGVYIYTTKSLPEKEGPYATPHIGDNVLYICHKSQVKRALRNYKSVIGIERHCFRKFIPIIKDELRRGNFDRILYQYDKLKEKGVISQSISKLASWYCVDCNKLNKDPTVRCSCNAFFSNGRDINHPSLKTKVKIMTLNVFGGHGTIGGNELQKRIRRQSPDILFLQEPFKSFKLDGYKHVCSSPLETVSTFVRRSCRWSFERTDVIKTSKCSTERDATVHTITNGDTSIKIANVHLCGGRFDEDDHVTDNIGDLKQTKEEVIKKLIKKDVSIVAGDFNSDMSHYIKKRCSSKQKKFLTSKGWSLKQISTWNKAPFNLLKKNAYEYAPCSTKTSVYGGIPDAVWYNPRTVELYNSVVVEMIDTEREYVTDHNGILCCFELISGK